MKSLKRKSGGRCRSNSSSRSKFGRTWDLINYYTENFEEAKPFIDEYKLYHKKALRDSSEVSIFFGSGRQPRCLECASLNVHVGFDGLIPHSCGEFLDVNESSYSHAAVLSFSVSYIYDTTTAWLWGNRDFKLVFKKISWSWRLAETRNDQFSPPWRGCWGWSFLERLVLCFRRFPLSLEWVEGLHFLMIVSIDWPQECLETSDESFYFSNRSTESATSNGFLFFPYWKQTSSRPCLLGRSEMLKTSFSFIKSVHFPLASRMEIAMQSLSWNRNSYSSPTTKVSNQGTLSAFGLEGIK